MWLCTENDFERSVRGYGKIGEIVVPDILRLGMPEKMAVDLHQQQAQIVALKKLVCQSARTADPCKPSPVRPREEVSMDVSLREATRRLPLLVAALTMLAIFAPAVFLQQGGQYEIKSSVIAGGGGTSTGAMTTVFLLTACTVEGEAHVRAPPPPVARVEVRAEAPPPPVARVEGPVCQRPPVSPSGIDGAQTNQNVK